MDDAEQSRHFELSEILTEHLLGEIALYCETNSLVRADMIYVMSQLLINVCISSELDIEKTKTVLIFICDKVLTEIAINEAANANKQD